jgi:single-strand DNA-binding protein
MSGNVNKIILVGNIGQDPELRTTSKGTAVTNLSLATHRLIRQESGEKEQKTDWHKAVVWGKRAETCAKHLKKGHRVYIEGLLQPRTWTDKEGNAHQQQEVVVERIEFLGGKSKDIVESSDSELESNLVMQ